MKRCDQCGCIGEDHHDNRCPDICANCSQAVDPVTAVVEVQSGAQLDAPFADRVLLFCSEACQG